MALPRLTRKRLMLAAVIVLVLLGAGFGAYYLDRHVPYWHFRTVQEGAFYRTGQLDGEQFAEAIEDYGIRTIVNLRHLYERAQGDWYEAEKRAASEKGVRLLDMPLMPGTPPSPEQIEELLAVWDDPKNRPVLVHCEHGSIRSAAAEGLWRREYMGENGAEAFDRVETWGRDLDEDYPDIARFIKEYVPRRDR